MPVKEEREFCSGDALAEAILYRQLNPSTVCALLLMAHLLEEESIASHIMKTVVNDLYDSRLENWFSVLRIVTSFSKKADLDPHFGQLVNELLEVDEKHYGRAQDYLKQLKMNATSRASCDPRNYATELNRENAQR